MKHDEDILAKAVEQLKQEGQSEQVPQEVLDETIRQLAQAQDGFDAGALSPARRPALVRQIIKPALAAAALLILGYAVGRISAPKPMDLEELEETLAPSVAAAIEPAIHEKLVEDLRHRYQLALVATYVKVKEELTEQYRSDLNRSAIQTLTASNAVTNRLLEDLLDAVRVRQAEDRRWVAVALKEIEAKRLEDSTRLGNAVINLAVQTDHRLQRTREDVVRLLADTEPMRLPSNDENPNHLN